MALQSEEKYLCRASSVLYYPHSLISGNIILLVSETEALILSWIGEQTLARHQFLL